MCVWGRRKKVKIDSVVDATWLSKSTVKRYYAWTLKWTATERKIAQYLDKIHNEEIKGIIKRS